MKKIYLAIPYTGMEEESYRMATEITAKLISKGDLNVLSPITHSHPLTRVPGVKIPGNWEYWEEVDYQFIDWADEMYIVVPHGDMKLVSGSTGVNAEMKYTVKQGKKVSYITEELVITEAY